MNTEFQRELNIKYSYMMGHVRRSKTFFRKDGYFGLYKILTLLNHVIPDIEEFTIHFSYARTCTLVYRHTIIFVEYENEAPFIFLTNLKNSDYNREIVFHPDNYQDIVDRYFTVTYLAYI